MRVTLCSVICPTSGSGTVDRLDPSLALDAFHACMMKLALEHIAVTSRLQLYVQLNIH
jgi:hypothetical protein